MTEQRRLTPATWGLLFLLACLWGGSFPANRAALAEVPVLTVVLFRAGGAALALWVYVALRGLAVPRGPRVWLIFLGIGFFNCALPFSLIVWGQQHIPGGLAAILNAATSVLAVGLSAVVFADERLTRAKVIGVTLGLLGVITAMGVENLAALDLGAVGQLAVLGAALSYAVTTIAARRLLTGIRPEVSAAAMLTTAAVLLAPVAVWSDGWPAFGYAPAVWGALAWLALASSALAYVLYYIVLTRAGAGNVSLVTLLVAPVAILLGAALFAERLDWHAYTGFALLAAGLLVIDGRISRASAPPSRADRG
jgi:drug/metabolite transporter (DMT)-like permease